MHSRIILLITAIFALFTGTAFADVAFPVGFRIAAYALPTALIALCVWVIVMVIRRIKKK